MLLFYIVNFYISDSLEISSSSSIFQFSHLRTEEYCFDLEQSLLDSLHILGVPTGNIQHNQNTLLSTLLFCIPDICCFFGSVGFFFLNIVLQSN